MNAGRFTDAQRQSILESGGVSDRLERRVEPLRAHDNSNDRTAYLPRRGVTELGALCAADTYLLRLVVAAIPKSGGALARARAAHKMARVSVETFEMGASFHTGERRSFGVLGAHPKDGDAFVVDLRDPIKVRAGGKCGVVFTNETSTALRVCGYFLCAKFRQP